MARKTKKSDTLPGIPFEFDFYMVYWEDIQSDSGWRTLKEIQKSIPIRTSIPQTIEWLIRVGQQQIQSELNYDNNTRRNQKISRSI